MSEPTNPDPMAVMQDDMAELLRALGLGDHARPASPHEVMVNEIIPAAWNLRARADGVTLHPWPADPDGAA
jgi:hypothetical protein